MKHTLGKNMEHALEFATRYRSWQTFNAKQRATREAIKRLEKRGLVEVNEFGQYRAKL